jgi:hypothetical protein
MPGPPPRGDRAATPAERSAAYRARRKATAADLPAKPPVVIRYRRPADRRSRPQQWADAVQTLADLLDQFEEWRDKLPSSLANSTTAEALDAVLELRGHVEDLQVVELPKGFGRDRRRSSVTLQEGFGKVNGVCHFRGRPHRLF